MINSSTQLLFPWREKMKKTMILLLLIDGNDPQTAEELCKSLLQIDPSLNINAGWVLQQLNELHRSNKVELIERHGKPDTWNITFPGKVDLKNNPLLVFIASTMKKLSDGDVGHSTHA